MGAVGGLLGVSGGANGTGFASPSTGNIVTPAQLTAAGTSANNALAQQQAFTAALNPGGQQGLAAQSQLLGQLQKGAAGQGPNPALAQLNQTTAANTANQAALMAGQRGASQNAGLIARQAAQQGAANQQQAAGQAATQQAQQQIAYQQALGQQANTQVGQAQSANQAQTQNALNQQLGLSNTAAGLQSSVNSANAGLAGQQMQNQAGLLGGVMQAGAASGVLGSGIAKSFGAGAEGGKVSELPVVRMASGGQYDQNFQGLTDKQWAGQQPLPMAGATTPTAAAPSTPTTPASGPTSSFGKFLKGAASTQTPAAQDKTIPSGNSDRFQSAEGGKVPALVSPGERYLSPKEVAKVAKGQKNPMEAGEKIPGKPKVGGAKNSYANDTVKKDLDEGGIVLPRSVTQSKHPHLEAHKFISAIMAKNGGKIK